MNNIRPNKGAIHFKVSADSLVEYFPSDPKQMELRVYDKTEIISSSLIYKQPTFLGEHYPISIKLVQSEMYEIEDLLITFCKIDVNKASAGEVLQVPKASIKSIDCPDDFDWNYFLYIVNSEEDKISVEKLEDHQYNVTSLEKIEQILNFFMEFRVEGRKSFEVIFRYKTRKKLNNLQSAFTLEHKELFNVDVLCPFILTTEWITPDPNVNCDNTHFYFIGQPRTHLGIHKKAILNAKITAGSFPKVKIYNVAFKSKDELIMNCTNEVTSWNNWPITLSECESLSLSFVVMALRQFNNQQVADIEILWNRNEESKAKRFICSIPLQPISTIESCVEISITSIPPKAKKFKEFLVGYAIKNTTESIIETKVRIEDSPHFYLAGEIETKIILPPCGIDYIKYAFIPLRCGKFDLPSLFVWRMVMGGMRETIINNNFKCSIYVFPS